MSNVHLEVLEHGEFPPSGSTLVFHLGSNGYVLRRETFEVCGDVKCLSDTVGFRRAIPVKSTVLGILWIPESSFNCWGNVLETVTANDRYVVTGSIGPGSNACVYGVDVLLPSKEVSSMLGESDV